MSAKFQPHFIKIRFFSHSGSQRLRASALAVDLLPVHPLLGICMCPPFSFIMLVLRARAMRK